MDLLIVPVPIFSKDIIVEAYYFRYQKGNEILDSRKGTSRLDGAMNSAPLEMLNTVSLETFTMGKPIFVPITSYMLLSNLENQCTQPSDKIIFLIDNTITSKPEYIDGMNRLKGFGFRFAIQKIEEVEPYEDILKLCDYIFYDHRIIDERPQQILRALVSRDYKHLKAVYTHIRTMELFEDVSSKAPGLYEGRFYRTPLTKGERQDAPPLQVNLINLLNVVRDEDFEFSRVTNIITKDPALSVALLRLVNSAYFSFRNKINTISQAVTMLGQKEVRKWITTAVSKLLGSDKPSEVTRLSLIRARFAECLAVKFGMESESDSLFLMGLFSVLDSILDMPIDEALKLVRVSDKIYNALVEGSGDYYPIYEFMQLYESANWNTLSRILILRGIPASDMYDAYLDALCWYRDVLTDNVQ